MSSSSSTIIVDGTVNDAIAEYGVILDSISQSNENSQLLHSLSQDDDSGSHNNELLSFINGSLETIFKLQDRDFEPVFNLYLYLITALSEESNVATVLQNSELTARGLAAVKAGQLQGTVVVSVLTTVFNVLPAQAAYRFELLQTIVEVLRESGNLKLLAASSSLTFEDYLTWLRPIADERQIAVFFLQIVQALSQAAQLGQGVFFADEALALYEKIVNEFHKVLTAAEFDQFLVESFNNEAKLDLSSYAKLQLDSASPDFKELLMFYNAKDLSSFETFYHSKEQASFKDINHAVLKLKLQIIKLISTCYGQTKISYDNLLTALALTRVEDLENLIIYAIKKGFLNGKLNQFKNTLELNHVTYLGDFNLDNWKSVSVKLNNWKLSLKEIKDNIDNKKK